MTSLKGTSTPDEAVEVAYRVVDSPVGPLLLAATPAGLAEIAFANHGVEPLLHALAGRVSPRLVESPERLDRAAAQLEKYFDGRRTQFDLALDLRVSGTFRRAVLERLREVSFGSTTTYRALAAAAGRPQAVRAVGSACATNPLPIVIGCHRVLRSDGGLGGYAGGLGVKQFLLDLEAGQARNRPGS